MPYKGVSAVISNANVVNNTVKFSIRNLTLNGLSGVVMASFYKGNYIVDIKFNVCDTPIGVIEDTVPTTNAEYDRIQLFYWNAIDTIRPLSAPYKTNFGL